LGAIDGRTTCLAGNTRLEIRNRYALRFCLGPIDCSECCWECRHGASLHSAIARAPTCIRSSHTSHSSRSRYGDARLCRPGLDRRGHPAMDGQQHRLLKHPLRRIARHVADS
jgi:hypothetical protein